MAGAGIALITALAWAISSIFLKFIASRIDTLSINTIRMWVGSIVLLTIVLVTHTYTTLVSVPLSSIVYVIISGILAMATGDTLYIKSLSYLDVSIAFTIAQCSFVVLAVLASIVLLREPFTWVTLTGAALVVLGIYLMTAMEKKDTGRSGRNPVDRKGIFILLISIFAWTAATLMLKIGVIGLDPIVAAGLRISASAIVLTLIYLERRGKGREKSKIYHAKDLGVILAAGILTYGIAAVGYIAAIQRIGAGKTVLITAVAPLFALPFSILILKERPTRHAITGIFLSVVGVGLVVV